MSKGGLPKALVSRSSCHIFSGFGCSFHFRKSLALKTSLMSKLHSTGFGLHRPQTPSFEHGLVFVPAVTVGRKHLLSGENCVGTSHEAKHLLRLRHIDPTSSKPDDSLWHYHSCCSNTSHHIFELYGLLAVHRRALYWHELVYRKGLRMFR